MSRRDCYGRKSGRGYYDYSGGAERQLPARRTPSRSSRARSGGEGVVVIAGAGALADELRAAARAAGYEVRSPARPARRTCCPSLAIDCSIARRGERRRRAASRTPEASRTAARGCCSARAARWPRSNPGGSAVGFHALPPLAETRLVELTRSESSSPVAAAARRALLRTRSASTWRGWATRPGWCSGGSSARSSTRPPSRSAKASAARSDIDLGMVLGLSHPRGPFAWADADRPRARARGARARLCEEYREERYRPAPALRRLWSPAGRLGGGGGLLPRESGACTSRSHVCAGRGVK